MQNFVKAIQARWKAVSAFVLTTAGLIVALYQANPNITLHNLVVSVIGGLITGAVVHQIPNIPIDSGEGV